MSNDDDNNESNSEENGVEVIPSENNDLDKFDSIVASGVKLLTENTNAQMKAQENILNLQFKLAKMFLPLLYSIPLFVMFIIGYILVRGENPDQALQLLGYVFTALISWYAGRQGVKKQ